MLFNHPTCLVCAVSLIALLGNSNSQKKTQSFHTKSILVVADIGRKIIGKPGLTNYTQDQKPVKSTHTTAWTYSETVRHTGAKIYTATISAPELLKFDAPFHGGSTVTLTIRKRDESTTIFLGVSKGQFTSKFQGGQIRIGFDNTASALYTFTAASDGSTDIIFLDSVQPIIAKLKTARKIVVDIGFYGQGVRRITFQTAGLKWK